jgi:hypothetical protein
LFALGQGVRIIAFGRRAFLQDRTGALIYDEAGRGTLPSRLSVFYAGVEHAAGQTFRSVLSDWSENVGAENGKELSNVCQKYFHVLAV